MKNITLIFLITLVTFSCRMSKQKQEQLAVHTKTQESLRQSSEALLWQWQDSSLSYWRLRTDSLFFYNPRMGIWGKGGEIFAAEARTQYSEGSMNTDIARKDSELDLTSTSYNWSQKIKGGEGSIFFGIMIVLVVLVIYRRV